LLIKSEYDIQFYIPHTCPMVALLHLHPSLDPRLTTRDYLKVEHTGHQLHPESGLPLGPSAGVGSGPGPDLPNATELPVELYLDSFGNRCSRFLALPGTIRLSGSNIIDAVDTADPQGFGLPQTNIENLPADTLQFLLSSRYCEVDRFGGITQDLFGHLGSGWALAASIRDWCHDKIIFNYKTARSTKTAMDVFTERIGVCRDYQHLAITMTRCMNIPARYVTGYIGDIRMPFSGTGDFSAWYQIFLDGKWWDMDARHNYPRLGRVLMATGRDAADIAITTSFGVANLTHFYVESNELDANGNPVPLPPKSGIATGSAPA
jgi:transglutaminase-like putative cysteine protease